MLALIEPLKLRLQSLPALAGWDVRSNTEAADRRALPAADIRCSEARIGDTKISAVMVAPQWALTLAVRRSPDAADLLGAAMTVAIEALHGWAPGQHGGRGWERLELLGITEPMFGDEGLVGYQLTFGTAAIYRGQP